MGSHWIDSLKGLHVVLTGKVFLREEYRTQSESLLLAKKTGAIPQAEFTMATDVVVWGNLSTQTVADMDRKLSRKLLRARESDRHVHVVNADGFADLLEGESARCLRVPSGKAVVTGTLDEESLIFGGPLNVHPPVTHSKTKLLLMMDLNKLDAATAAHQETLAQLKTFLASHSVIARRHAASGPRFDAGWTWKKQRWIAEVKSILEGDATQQIRLGVGQLVEYRARVPSTKPPRATLVLSRMPTSSKWNEVCASVGIVLTWPPYFPGLLG